MYRPGPFPAPPPPISAPPLPSHNDGQTAPAREGSRHGLVPAVVARLLWDRELLRALRAPEGRHCCLPLLPERTGKSSPPLTAALPPLVLDTPGWHAETGVLMRVDTRAPHAGRR